VQIHIIFRFLLQCYVICYGSTEIRLSIKVSSLQLLLLQLTSIKFLWSTTQPGPQSYILSKKSGPNLPLDFVRLILTQQSERASPLKLQSTEILKERSLKLLLKLAPLQSSLRGSSCSQVSKCYGHLSSAGPFHLRRGLRYCNLIFKQSFS
jgi:hypothetical protein